MSKTNYDVELPIIYSDEWPSSPGWEHKIMSYAVQVPAYKTIHYTYSGDTAYYFDVFFSLDDESEEHLEYGCNNEPKPWNREIRCWTQSNKYISYSGIYEKAYFRNPNRYLVNFNVENCRVVAIPESKVPFEIQWNSTGFAANSNAWFKCSTVQKNCYYQYEWDSATVYYKASTDENYSSVSGTVSGSWADVRISTNLTLQDGVTYDVYITAVSDDGETATTPVAQFSTTDAAAVASCISPSGAFTSGDVTFVWSHSTEYGTPQYAYDLQYSNNNGSSWTTVGSHVVTSNSSATATLTSAGVYIWRVRTYNSNDVAGEWAQASFVNQVPANPPTNINVTSKGRPTVSWTAVSQSAYQVQFLLTGTVVYDSGAVYTSETSHFVNKYLLDNRSYVVRVRIYNALGEISDWGETGYQQPDVSDVEFTIEDVEDGGIRITITPNVDFVKYYILRNDKPIYKVVDNAYTDMFAVGLTNYSVLGVTSGDQSDIKSIGYRVKYPKATLIDRNNQTYVINKRVDSAYEVQTSNEADVNKAQYLGDSHPSHYASNMRLKSFSITCFDEQGVMEDLLGTMVFYADNFGNGGWCMVTAYDKTDNFIQNGAGAYANEVSLTLEVTNYDDSIEYPL